MEVKYLVDKKNIVEFEIPGVSHGFCNLLKEELVLDKNVEVASYKVDHPMLQIPIIIVQGKNPKASIKAAVESLKTKVAEMKKEIKKL